MWRKVDYIKSLEQSEKEEDAINTNLLQNYRVIEFKSSELNRIGLN